jgi:hypothetical protein
VAYRFAVALDDTNIITGEKPPHVKEGENFMLKQFQAVEPELKGQIQPEESVRKSLQVIERLDAETSGQLLSHNGNRYWF